MEITIYAKKRTTESGKPFYSYLTRLTKKNGDILLVSVKFKEECGNPKAEQCPMNINIARDTANLISTEYTRKDSDEIGIGYTLWVSEWSEGSPFIDHSLDEFV